MMPLAMRLAKSHEVFLPDMPGYGASTPLDTPYSHTEVNERVVETLHSHDIQSCDIVCMSLGAYRAFGIALDGAISVGRIVALSPFAGLDDSEREGFGQLAAMLRNSESLEGAFGAMFVSRWFSGSTAPTDEIVSEALSWLHAAPPSVLADEMAAISKGEDLRQRLGGISVPVLLRVGESDLATSPAHVESIANALPHSTVQVVPGKGHLLILEDFDATVNATLEFLL